MPCLVGSVGIYAKFVRKLDENRTRAGDEEKSGPNSGDFAIDMSNLNATLMPQLVELFNTSVSINSTKFKDMDPESGAAIFIGNKTETALLKFTKDLSWANYKETRDTANVMPSGCAACAPHGGVGQDQGSYVEVRAYGLLPRLFGPARSVRGSGVSSEQRKGCSRADGCGPTC